MNPLESAKTLADTLKIIIGNQQGHLHLSNKVKDLLALGKFNEADLLVLDNKIIKEFEYEQMKAGVILRDLKRLEQKLNLKFADQEKAKSLSVDAPAILLEARAGSGKTTTIALKFHQLITYYGLKPEEILVLAFNREASNEFRERINKYCSNLQTGTKLVADKTNTLTFHALASRISNTNKNLLQPDLIKTKKSNVNDKTFFQFVKESYEESVSKNPSLLNKLFLYFLRSVTKPKQEQFSDHESYYLYRRNLKHASLNGEQVKSIGEKYIADFLLEHNLFYQKHQLSYKYAWNVKKLLDTKYPYSPDFSLYSKFEENEKLELVIEYFGFTATNNGFPEFFNSLKESQKYLRDARNKIELFKGSEIPFIYITIDEFNSCGTAREKFEKLIRIKLEDKGIIVSNKLGWEEILKKIPKFESKKKDLILKIKNFISLARKDHSPNKVRKNAEQYSANKMISKRTSYFLKIVSRVYDQYQVKLDTEDYIDFDGLLESAITEIDNKGDSTVLRSSHGNINLSQIKYILIDEYQDFTPSFNELIRHICIANSSIKLFCVGDDWQAINSFAGSNLQYFQDFENYFENSKRSSLLTNYRSNVKIVNHGNKIMQGKGDPGKAYDLSDDGSVTKITGLCRVEMREDNEDFRYDKPYLESAIHINGKQSNTILTTARYLKTLKSIIDSLDETTKSVFLIFRSNNFYGAKIKSSDNDESISIEYQLKKLVKNKKSTLTCITAHSSKGKEADAVIIVDANCNRYPLLHPDKELTSILGISLSSIIDDERRLFYVAATRAKRYLYLLIDDEKGPSDFIVNSGWVTDKENDKLFKQGGSENIKIEKFLQE